MEAFNEAGIQRDLEKFKEESRASLPTGMMPVWMM